MLLGFKSLCIIPLSCICFIASTIYLNITLTVRNGNGSSNFFKPNSNVPPLANSRTI